MFCDFIWLYSVILFAWFGVCVFGLICCAGCLIFLGCFSASCVFALFMFCGVIRNVVCCGVLLFCVFWFLGGSAALGFLNLLLLVC